MSDALHLTEPLEAAEGLERLYPFAGRHVGEDEFDREQRHREARLAPLLAGRTPGAVAGLMVHVPGAESGSSGPSLIIDPGVGITASGLAVVLEERLRPRYRDLRLPERDGQPAVWLTNDEAKEGETSAPDGLYVLTLERHAERMDPPTTEPSRRDERDPLRDARWEWVTRLVAHPLEPEPGLPLPPLSADPVRIANVVCASYLPEHISRYEARGVALVLVAVSAGQVLWADPLAVRREARPDGPRWALLAQLRRALGALPPLPQTFKEHAAFFEAHWKLDFLPAAGPLPHAVLVDPASSAPSCPFFPAHLGVELTAVPASAAEGIVATEIGRGPLELRSPTGDRVRLLVVVPDDKYRFDLLDKPQASDAVIERLHRSFVQARVAWWRWNEARLRLFAAVGTSLATGETVTFVDGRIRLTAEVLKALGAVVASDELEAPQTSDAFVQSVMERETLETQAEGASQLPEPYRAFESATHPVHFGVWRQGRLTLDEAEKLSVSPRASQHGLVVQRAFWLAYSRALSADLEEARERVQLLRDHAMELRQQFDAHSVNLASLVGGLSNDGLGLSLSRWLPNINLGSIGKAAVESSGALGKAVSQGPAALVAKVGVVASPAVEARAAAVVTPVLSMKAVTHPKLEPVLTATPAGVGLVNAYREESFGVMRHVRPDVYQMEHAFQAYRELYARLERVVRRAELMEWDELKDALDPEAANAGSGAAVTWKTAFVNSLASRTPAGAGRLERKTLLRLHADVSLKDSFGAIIGSLDRAVDKKGLVRIGRQDTYRWLVALGQRQAKLIGHAEAVLRKWEAIISASSRELEGAGATLQSLERGIAQAGTALSSLDTARREAADDYHMARLLADEDWGSTELSDEERTRLLSAPLGLIYVRLRQTISALPVTDPLPLRAQARGDVVPGASEGSAVPLPDALDPFLDALWEVPIGDYARLRALESFLPDRNRLVTLAGLRRARLSGRAGMAWTLPYERLGAVFRQHTALVYGILATQYVPAMSLAESHRRALSILSIADVAQAPSGRLRDAAQLVRHQLELGAGCLLAELRHVGAAQRFDWAQAADDDRLNVKEPSTWLGIGNAAGRGDPALHLRTLVELVDWFWKQLSGEASDGGVNAIRNLLRAILIHAAHGDAGSLARGEVLSVPARLAPGSPLRARLDREVPIGSQMHLLAPSGAIAGIVRVDDHDEHGAIVRVIQLRSSDAVTTQFTLAARRG